MRSAFGPFGLATQLRRSSRSGDRDELAPPDIWIRETSTRRIEHVLALGQNAEIVLWRLAGRYLISRIRPGDLIAFSVGGVIVGVAVYSYSLSLGYADAWKEFGPGLGVKTIDGLEQLVDCKRRQAGADTPAIITCRVVTDFSRLDASFLDLTDLPRAESGGRLSMATDLGQQIVTRWQAHQRQRIGLEDASLVTPDPEVRSRRSEIRPGQRLFHDRAMTNYEGACIVSGETAAPALIAAHIHPFAISGNHDLTNALLLRSDLHPLFDQGYWTIGRDGRVRFSSKFQEDYPNSRYALIYGDRWLKALRVAPVGPSRDMLDWHLRFVFLDRDVSF